MRFIQRAESYANRLKRNFPEKTKEIDKDIAELKAFNVQLFEELDKIRELNDEAIGKSNAMIQLSRKLVEMAKEGQGLRGAME